MGGMVGENLRGLHPPSPPCRSAPAHVAGARVYKTGGNRSGLTGYRSNRSGPVSVSVPKILQGAMNLMVSNFLKMCCHRKQNGSTV